MIQKDVNYKLERWNGLADMLQEASMRNSIQEPCLLSSLLLVCGNSTANVSFVRDNAIPACNIESYYLHYVASSKDGLFREEDTENQGFYAGTRKRQRMPSEEVAAKAGSITNSCILSSAMD